MSSQLQITLVKSPIGSKEPHKRTLKALGLKKLHATVTKDNTPSIRGMVNQVQHLVVVEETS